MAQKQTSFKRLRLWFLLIAAITGATASNSAVADSTYDETRRLNNPTPLDSVSQLRANIKALDGHAVEFGGEVTGVMTREGGRVVLLKVGEEMAVLTAPPALAKSELLRAGTLVRLLARLQDDGRHGVLTILALVAGVAPAKPAQNDDAAELIAGIDSGSLSGPMATTIISLPQPPGDQTSSTPGRRSQSAPRATPTSTATATTTTVKSAAAVRTVSSVQDTIEEQVPAYAAIVRRHNKKLKPEVVEEISIAILRAGMKYNMDPRFLAAIIAVESDFDVYSLSKSGAMGLGQLMPFNLKEAGVKNAWNPTENIMGCAKLLRGHLDDYKNRPNSTLLAVAAYNAGPGAVRRAGYQVPNGAQVQRYVWKVYYRYKAFAPDMF